ncbi:putative HlyD family secretion protein [Nitrospina gracilis 3/211]|uniref:Putative HlyD family secretion protein n=1 Tax=Nitrospina gracilis (strain 3/211) TaxID=1266370 RepID=M1Z1A0_NITG3|nr:putative HlyD family secretion protein [Nitrospina gracilis 3/211]
MTDPLINQFVRSHSYSNKGYLLPKLGAVFLVCLIFWPSQVWSQFNFTVPVGVAKAVKRSVREKIELPGTVYPWATTQLSAEIDGRVERILFNEGDRVKKGDPLVKLRIRPLLLERDLAVAEKRRIETLLQELETGTRQETIEAARHAVDQAKARLTLAENELRRIKKLYQEGVLSLDAYDKAAAEADQAAAFLQEKSSVLEELVAGPRIERIQQEKANLEAANARIHLIEDNIQQGTIYAPFDGYITKKLTEVGQWLEKGDQAVAMIAASPLKVEVNIPQFQFNEVRVGSAAEIILENRDTNGKPLIFSGNVIEKVPQGDPVSRTFPIRIKVSTTNSTLAPGMLVKVRFTPNQKDLEKRMFVPKDSIVRTPKGANVWVVRENEEKKMMAYKVTVKTGKLVDSMIAVEFIEGKIEPGEWVVVDGNERLKPDTEVRIINKHLN